MYICSKLHQRGRRVYLVSTTAVRKIMFVFDMPKVVRIRSISLGLAYRSFQIMILAYFILFVMWWKKGYQTFNEPICGVTAKVKGVALMEHYRWNDTRWNSEWMLWDNGENYMQPLQQGGFRLVTRIGTKTRQKLGYCEETSRLPDAQCLSDADCTSGSVAGPSVTRPDGTVATEDEIDLEEDGHGVFTGKCPPQSKTCEVYAWCPINSENAGSSIRYTHLITPPNVLGPPYSYFKDISFMDERRKNTDLLLRDRIPFFDVLNFTVFIKSAIEFPAFKVKRVNVLPWMNETYLKECMYDPTHPQNKYCPIFRIYDILRYAESNITTLLFKGGVISINVLWDCDFDWSVEYCVPKYTFGHLDGPVGDAEDNLPGTNGLSSDLAVHFGNLNENQANRPRSLVHTHGINFIIRATGKAGKFSLLNFTMRLGAALALLSVGTIVCNFVVFHFTPDRHRYREASCDDKTLKRLLKMAAVAQFTSSRRTQLLMSHQARTRSKPSIDTGSVNVP